MQKIEPPAAGDGKKRSSSFNYPTVR